MTDTTLNDSALHRASGTALKRLALDPRCRAAFLDNAWLRELLQPAAGRYVVATDRDELWRKLGILADKGYRVGVEYVGEEVRDPALVRACVDEYLALVREMPRHGLAPQLGFDLSAVGLLLSPELAIENTERLLRAAADHGVTIVLSMERSEMTQRILDVFHQLAPDHVNLGITLQAHLHRTVDDLDGVLATGRKLRLVKGVYNEPAEVALPRGPALDARYVELLRRAAEVGGVVAVASHDGALHERIREAGLLGACAELEMLHGVRPDALRQLRDEGVPCRISAVYGTNWFLHVMHRIAECPTNILESLADLADPARLQFARDY